MKEEGNEKIERAKRPKGRVINKTERGTDGEQNDTKEEIK
jgi:hypothetical protein